MSNIPSHEYSIVQIQGHKGLTYTGDLEHLFKDNKGVKILPLTAHLNSPVSSCRLHTWNKQQNWWMCEKQGAAYSYIGVLACKFE